MTNPYINYTINLCRFATKMINKITRDIDANKNYTIKLSGVELKSFNVNIKNYKNVKITLKSSKRITDKLLEYFQLFCDTYTQLSRCKVNSSKYKKLLTLTQKLKTQFIEFLISSRDYNGGTSELYKKLPSVDELVEKGKTELREKREATQLARKLPKAPTNALSTKKATSKRGRAIAIPRRK